MREIRGIIGYIDRDRMDRHAELDLTIRVRAQDLLGVALHAGCTVRMLVLADSDLRMPPEAATITEAELIAAYRALEGLPAEPDPPQTGGYKYGGLL